MIEEISNIKRYVLHDNRVKMLLFFDRRTLLCSRFPRSTCRHPLTCIA